MGSQKWILVRKVRLCVCRMHIHTCICACDDDTARRKTSRLFANSNAREHKCTNCANVSATTISNDISFLLFTIYDIREGNLLSRHFINLRFYVVTHVFPESEKDWLFYAPVVILFPYLALLLFIFTSVRVLKRKSCFRSWLCNTYFITS